MLVAEVARLRREERGSELELHIITDNQALAWDSFSAGGSAQWDPSIVEDNDGVFITLLGVSAPENIGPAEIELLPPIGRPESNAEVTTTLTQTGVNKPSTVTIFINNEESARRTIGDSSSDGSSPRDASSPSFSGDLPAVGRPLSPDCSPARSAPPCGPSPLSRRG